MANLTKLANHWDRAKLECRAIIETPKGGRNKFDYDPKTRLFMLGGLLGKGLAFPYDFGFIPSTLGDDGDPLDIMVFMDEPAHVGCLIDVRLIGLIEAEQADHRNSVVNNRLVGVSIHSYAHENVSSLNDVNESLLDQVEEFFVACNIDRGKKFKLKGHFGPKHARKALEAGIAQFKRSAGR